MHKLPLNIFSAWKWLKMFSNSFKIAWIYMRMQIRKCPMTSHVRFPLIGQLSPITQQLPRLNHAKTADHIIFSVTHKKKRKALSTHFCIRDLTDAYDWLVQLWWIEDRVYAIIPTLRAWPCPLAQIPGHRWPWHHRESSVRSQDVGVLLCHSDALNCPHAWYLSAVWWNITTILLL